MKKIKVMQDVMLLELRYVIKNENFDYLILMDGDGEDRPVEIKDLIKIKKIQIFLLLLKELKDLRDFFFNFI